MNNLIKGIEVEDVIYKIDHDSLYNANDEIIEFIYGEQDIYPYDSYNISPCLIYPDDIFAVVYNGKEYEFKFTPAKKSDLDDEYVHDGGYDPKGGDTRSGEKNTAGMGIIFKNSDFIIVLQLGISDFQDCYVCSSIYYNFATDNNVDFYIYKKTKHKNTGYIFIPHNYYDFYMDDDAGCEMPLFLPETCASVLYNDQLNKVYVNYNGKQYYLTYNSNDSGGGGTVMNVGEAKGGETRYLDSPYASIGQQESDFGLIDFIINVDYNNNAFSVLNPKYEEEEEINTRGAVKAASEDDENKQYINCELEVCQYRTGDVLYDTYCNFYTGSNIFNFIPLIELINYLNEHYAGQDELAME